MLPPIKTVSAAIELAHAHQQLKAQNDKLIASLKEADENLRREQSLVNVLTDAILDEHDPDRRVTHVLDVLRATLAVITAVQRDPEPTQTESEALAELDRVRGTAK